MEPAGKSVVWAELIWKLNLGADKDVSSSFLGD